MRWCERYLRRTSGEVGRGEAGCESVCELLLSADWDTQLTVDFFSACRASFISLSVYNTRCSHVGDTLLNSAQRAAIA